MPADTLNNISNNNNLSFFKKGNYVSFNSENPKQYSTYTYTTSDQKSGHLLKGIVEKVGHGSVIINCRSIEYRRDEFNVTLISEKHLYIRCKAEK